ncbi:hypothetical protein K440DRAFT_638596 [Wilcoxina mikolae CBS 423.85]|nr:hypothetical protein K440DRAFT_638596 [Wilcoxina mikolae CBS 423.85]
MKLDPKFRKRDFDIFGHNGLAIGDLSRFVPFGTEPTGPAGWNRRKNGRRNFLYGRFVSGQSEYNDKYSGLELYYSGMHGEAPSAGDTAAQLTSGVHGSRSGATFNPISTEGNDLISDEEQSEIGDEYLQTRPSVVWSRVGSTHNARGNPIMIFDPRFK